MSFQMRLSQGQCRVEEFAYIGRGAVVKQSAKLFTGLLRRRRAVVVKDIAEGAEVCGSPQGSDIAAQAAKGHLSGIRGIAASEPDQ